MSTGAPFGLWAAAAVGSLAVHGVVGFTLYAMPLPEVRTPKPTEIRFASPDQGTATALAPAEAASALVARGVARATAPVASTALKGGKPAAINPSAEAAVPDAVSSNAQPAVAVEGLRETATATEAAPALPEARTLEAARGQEGIVEAPGAGPAAPAAGSSTAVAALEEVPPTASDVPVDGPALADRSAEAAVALPDSTETAMPDASVPDHGAVASAPAADAAPRLSVSEALAALERSEATAEALAELPALGDSLAGQTVAIPQNVPTPQPADPSAPDAGTAVPKAALPVGPARETPEAVGAIDQPRRGLVPVNEPAPVPRPAPVALPRASADRQAPTPAPIAAGPPGAAPPDAAIASSPARVAPPAIAVTAAPSPRAAVRVAAAPKATVVSPAPSAPAATQIPGLAVAAPIPPAEERTALILQPRIGEDEPEGEQDGTPGGRLRIGDFLAAREGDDCLLAVPGPTGTQAAAVEAFAVSAAAVERLGSDYEDQAGIALKAETRPVSEQQCSALLFARSLPQYPNFLLRLTIAEPTIRSGRLLQGVVSGLRKDTLYLIVVDDEGKAKLLDSFLDVRATLMSFREPVRLTSGPVASVQLLVAIASDGPLKTAPDRRGMAADEFFSRLATEIVLDNRSIAYGITSFRVE